MCLKGAVRVWRGGFLLEEYKCLSFNCSKNEYDVNCVRASIGDRANAGFGGLGAGEGDLGDKPSPTDSWYSGPDGRETRALLCDSILGAAMAPVVVFGYALSYGVGYRGGEGSAL